MSNEIGGIYDYIDRIDNKDLFKYLIVISAAMAVTTHAELKFSTVAGLVGGLMVVYYMNDRKVSLQDDYNEELERRLSYLRLSTRLDYLWYDPDLINFYYNIREFRDYNNRAYTNSIKAAEQMMALRSDLETGVAHPEHNLDVAKDKMKIAMNNLASIIHSTPGSVVTNEKYQKAVTTLQLILRRQIDLMHEICRKQRARDPNGPDIYTHYPENSGPVPNDVTYDNHYTMFN